MKNFWKIFGFSVLGIVAIVYLAFLFVLPNVIDLNQYLPMIQELVKEQTNFNLEIKNPKIITSPFLEAGIKTDEIKLTLADGSPVFETDSIKAKVFLPSALLLSARVSCLEINKPNITLDINENGTQYKLITEIENILNTAKNEVKEEPENSWFNPEWIRIYVPNIKISNYNASVNDIRTQHHLEIKGDELKLGYFNGKRAKIKTYAYLLSDDKTNVTANIKLDTYIPEMKKQKLDPEDDKEQKIEIPFINIVEAYQNYDLQTHVNSKLRIRPTHDKTSVKMCGFFNVDNLTLRLANYQLPKCYLHTKMRGTTVNLDTDLYVTPEEHTNIIGKINYYHPAIDISIKGNKVYFNDIIVFSKAILDSLNIKNDFANLKGQGYILANADINTNFKKLKSNGNVIIRDGSILNNTIGLVITDTNSDLLFDNNIFSINNTRTKIGEQPLTINGSINNKTHTDITIKTKYLPITGLYRALAPSDIKRNFDMKSGNISIDAKLFGKIKEAVSTLTFDLSDLKLVSANNSLNINNGNFNIKLLCNNKEKLLKGKITNSNLDIVIPTTNSVISDKNLVIDFDMNNINIQPTNLVLNSGSNINIKGCIAEYSLNPQINISGNGNLITTDLRKFCGSVAEPYIDAKGSLPLKFSLIGNDKRQSLTAQILSNSRNYITPIHFRNIRNSQCISQLKLNYKGDRLNIKDTGIFTTPATFSEDLNANMSGAKPVIRIHGTLAKLDTKFPTINLLKVDIPNSLQGRIYAIKHSAFNLDGNLIAFGRIARPFIHGGFNITQLRMPTLLTQIEQAGIKLNGHSFRIFADNINLNGSDINFSANSNMDFSPVIKLHRLRVTSNNFDLDKVMKVSELATKILPSTPQTTTVQTESADIPIQFTGYFNFNRIKTGDIVLNNTRGRIAMNDNTLFIRPVRTNIFKGNAGGNISVNLVNGLIDMDLSGSNIDCAQALKDATGMTDAIAGTTEFALKAQLQGSTYEEQMKSLKGNVKFRLRNGSFGPFGKLENMILSENIRQSKFFETAIGSLLGGLATVDTAHFEELKGKITFKNGNAIIDDINSKGDVMCIHLAGKYDLLKNEADMKVRGRLASMVSNMLGPIAALNPVNLLKATPGINVAMAKAFSIFTVPITQEEMDAIPDFGKYQSDLAATKFQIVLEGDVAKPLAMFKSFKWLALQSDIDNAQYFADNLPEEYLLADPTTPEAQAAAAAKAKEEARPINKIKRKLNIGQEQL